MCSKEKIYAVLDKLSEAGLSQNLININFNYFLLHTDSILMKIYRMIISLGVLTSIVTLIVNRKVFWICLLYWVGAFVLTFLVDWVSSWLVLHGICRKPRIYMIPEDIYFKSKVKRKFDSYYLATLPTTLILKIHAQIIKTFEQEPVFIAVNYLGIKILYRLETRVLTDSFYNKCLNEDYEDVVKYIENLDEDSIEEAIKIKDFIEYANFQFKFKED